MGIRTNQSWRHNVLVSPYHSQLYSVVDITTAWNNLFKGNYRASMYPVEISRLLRETTLDKSRGVTASAPTVVVVKGIQSK